MAMVTTDTYTQHPSMVSAYLDVCPDAWGARLWVLRLVVLVALLRVVEGETEVSTGHSLLFCFIL